MHTIVLVHVCSCVPSEMGSDRASFLRAGERRNRKLRRIVRDRRCVRLRLAVLWPVLLGLATLAVLARNQQWLDPVRPSKISRRWVYLMMARSCPAVTSHTILRGWIRELRQRVQAAL